MPHNIFTDNPDFYPTPQEVIDQMLLEVDVRDKVVLEPSAGKGDIVTSLIEAGAKEVLACENDPNLLWTLQMSQPADRFRLLKEDFLRVTREDVAHVDAIVANPPFSHAAEHIAHMWEIAPDGCTIVALCNEDSLEGNCSEKWEKVRELLRDHGRKLTLHDAFASAERRTDVVVAMLTLRKGAAAADPFEGYFFSKEEDEAFGGSTAGLMPYNAVRDIVQRYVTACRLFNEVNRLSHEINALAQYNEPAQDGQRMGYAPYLPIVFGARRTDDRYHTAEISFDTYRKELQKYYWGVIFHKLNLEKYSTSKLREQISRFVEQQQDMPFTMRNIYAVLDIVIQTNGQRMQEALVEAFEKICSYSAENSTAGEKWKTNADYMVNRRFIVPDIAAGEEYGYRNENVKISYYGHHMLDDVVKALCFVTGTRWEDTPSLDVFHKTRHEWGQWYDWGFFRIKFFRKGTAHCEFLDEETWYRFNAEVARIKGWQLPKNTGKSRKNAA